MPRLIGLSALLLLVTLTAATPADAALKSCSVRGKERKLGATYVTTLKVDRTSCASAEKVVKAFHRCRRANGGADGFCRARVSEYACKETRFNKITTQYDSRVTCRRGTKRISFTYTQFT